MVSFQFVTLLFLGISLISCAPHHCRRSSEVVPPVPPGVLESGKDRADKMKPKVWIYKYDGSLQCKQGLAVSLEDMARELDGIRIFEQKKKPDGLMHIQLCGSPTGMANVYQISADDLERAEKKGFRTWTFD